MRRVVALSILAGALAFAPQAAKSQLLQVGRMAPDFSLTGATRDGVLANPVKLSDYRGKTVVLAFFFQVRTPG
jgi:hypothetical protein